MATIIWITIWGWIALVGGVILTGIMRIFILGEPKEDVIDDVHDLFVGGVEELD